MKSPYRLPCPPPKLVDEMPSRPRRTPLMRAIVKLVALAVVVVAMTACSWFQANASYFPTPADVSCVYAAVENGVQDPAGVIAACPNLAALAIEDLIRLISGLVLGKAHRIEAEKAKASAAAVSVSGPPVHVIVVDGGAK